MHIRKIVLAAALLALALVGASSASATTLDCGNKSTPCPVPTTITANTITGHATLTNSLGNITCDESSFHGDVTSNHVATLSGTLTSLTFGTGPNISPSHCSGTGFASFLGIAYCNGGDASMTAVGTGAGTGTVTLGSGYVVTCRSSSGSALCTFTTTAAVSGNATATFDGTGKITGSELHFSTSAVTGSGSCPASGNAFTVTYTNVHTANGTLVALTS